MTFQPLAQASPQPRGSVFPATVEDGTPHVIRVRKTHEVSRDEEERVMESDATEEQLESLIKAPAPVKVQTRAQTPQVSVQASSSELDALKTEVQGLKSQVQEIQAGSNLSPPTTPVPTVDSVPTKKMRTAGERVPQEHMKDMARRISAAAQILKKYGIAYDYRVMTLRDFIRVEERLSKHMAQKNQEESAPSEMLSDN